MPIGIITSLVLCTTLYIAVAQILTYVFQLKVGQKPPRPEIQVQE